MSHAAKMVGPPNMNFGATRGDGDRAKKAKDKNAYIDSQPTDPEWVVWKMRPREKKKEIGPSMRFNSHFQAERLMEALKNQTQTFFTKEMVTGQGPDNQNLERNIKEYTKTGKFSITGPASFVDDDLYSPGSPASGSQSPQYMHTRQSKLQRSNYFLDPRQMMKPIHQKTHFKAAISVSRAQPVSVKIQKNEFGDQFAEISRNIEAMNRSMKHFKSGSIGTVQGKRGSQVTEYLARNRDRNCISQGRQRRPKNVGLIGSHAVGDNNTFNSLADTEPGSASKEPQTNLSNQDHANLSEEEKKAIAMLSNQEISPENVTSQVLKLCNVVR